MFDDFLQRHAARHDLPFQPFEIETDYLPYVDGKPRLRRAEEFSRFPGIHLPEGRPEDPPGSKRSTASASVKTDFLKQIREKGANVYGSTRGLDPQRQKARPENRRHLIEQKLRHDSGCGQSFGSF
jgi:hypothetical protein